MAIIWRFSKNSLQLDSKNYEAQKRKIWSSNSDYSYSNRQSFVFQLPIILSRNIAILGGKYEARIAIFRIFAAIDRFSRISQKVESRWGKSESRWRNRKAVSESGKPVKKSESCWRNRKAVEEDFLGFLGNEKAVEENRTLSKENWILRKDFARKIGSYERIS
jgi:hypothetical protein